LDSTVFKTFLKNYLIKKYSVIIKNNPWRIAIFKSLVCFKRNEVIIATETKKWNTANTIKKGSCNTVFS